MPRKGQACLTMDRQNPVLTNDSIRDAATYDPHIARYRAVFAGLPREEQDKIESVMILLMDSYSGMGWVSAFELVGRLGEYANRPPGFDGHLGELYKRVIKHGLAELQIKKA